MSFTRPPSSRRESVPPPLAQYHSVSYAVRAQLLSVLAILPQISFPMWWAALVDERKYSLVSLGLLNTAQMAGQLVCAVALIFAIRKLDRRLTAAAALATMAAAYVSVMWVLDIHWIIPLFALSAAAAWAAIALASLYLGYTANPDRSFAMGVTLATLAQSAVVFIFPRLYSDLGNAGVQLLMAGLLLTGAGIAVTLPPCMPDVEEQARFVEGPDGSGEARKPGELIWLAAVPIFFATICFEAYNQNVFAYSERVGEARGLDMRTIGNILSLAMLCGAAGSLLALAMGKRFGRLVPVIGGAALAAISSALLLNHFSGVQGYAIGLALFSIVWSLVQPYISAQSMAIDYSGRVIVAAGPVVRIGGVGTAAAVTWLSSLYATDGVLWFTLAAILLCPLFMGLSVVLLKPHVARAVHARWRRIVPAAPCRTDVVGAGSDGRSL